MRVTFLLLIVCTIMAGHVTAQNVYFQLDQAHGISSYYPAYGHYIPKYAYQYGLGVGIRISERLDLSSGCAYQMGGSSDVFWEADLPTTRENATKQSQNATFLKVPLDVNFTFMKKHTWTLGLGFYYRFNLNAYYATESQEGETFKTLDTVHFGHNDFGIGIKPGIIFPLSSKFQIKAGLMQEFGLYAFWGDYRHFNTEIFIALKYSRTDQTAK